MQFGLSYKCEICHRNKWNVIESLHYIFPTQGTCYHGNYVTHSVAPPNSKAVVLLREQVGEIFLNLNFLNLFFLLLLFFITICKTTYKDIQYATLLILLALLTTQYYITFSLTFAHTQREKKKKKKETKEKEREELLTTSVLQLRIKIK